MGPGARPGASAYPNLSHPSQPAASDSESESLTGRLRSLSLPDSEARPGGPGSEAAGSEWPPESGRAGTRLGMPRARRPGPGTGIIRVSASDSDSESEPRPLTRTWPRGGDPVDSGRIHDHEGNRGIT